MRKAKIDFGDTKFVNIYLIDKAYGGPEEGGWYYTYGIALRSHPVSMETKNSKKLLELKIKQQQNLVDEANSKRNSDISSVASEGMYVVSVEDNPPCDFPEKKPHYE